MIKLDNISYRYRAGLEALSGVSAQIPEGIHLLLGENGAGKTTLLHVISGLLFSNSGSCRIDGIDMKERLPEGLAKVFFLADNVDFPQYTINKFASVHSPFYSKFNRELFEENLREFGLTGNEKFRSLSLGNKRKSLLAYSLALCTEVLLLDEPANGLDIGSKQILRRMIARCAGNFGTVIISTHTVNDLEYLFDGVLMLKRGKLILSESMCDIQRSMNFVTASIPPVESVFCIPNLGSFRCIVPSDETVESEIDLVLLYLAMQSKESDKVLNLLNSQEK
ncbi:MAG: ABC transporter ATP-binding protein [Paramuribaculum sp.]|nr:ABC transporter ATP-binding protein [Paramuribaculum sp.]